MQNYNNISSNNNGRSKPLSLLSKCWMGKNEATQKLTLTNCVEILSENVMEINRKHISWKPTTKIVRGESEKKIDGQKANVQIRGKIKQTHTRQK